jgi:membrane-bound metal-dependent hydrolase YbcI (DUF457 family)
MATHLLSDWLTTAGVPLRWPIDSSRQSAGIVTVWDLPIAVTLYASFVAVFRYRARPALVIAVLSMAMALYVRWKRKRLAYAVAFLCARHYVRLDNECWVHPWACVPWNYSLCSSTGAVDTVTWSTQHQVPFMWVRFGFP